MGVVLMMSSGSGKPRKKVVVECERWTLCWWFDGVFCCGETVAMSRRCDGAFLIVLVPDTFADRAEASRTCGQCALSTFQEKSSNVIEVALFVHLNELSYFN